MTNKAPEVIDDLSCMPPMTPIGTSWEMLTDAVMGGLSQGRLGVATTDGKAAVRLTGDISLANNGGFVQMALDLAPSGTVDATGWTGIALKVSGNGEGYKMHLRTSDFSRPWQSYRADFVAGAAPAVIRLPFAAFQPHRTDAQIDLSRLRRVGLVAIGRAFKADLALHDLRFYS
jgi:hypothetical protein